MNLRGTIAALLSAAALAGCGYGLGYRAPDQVRTVAVPIFNNETFPLRREVEYELTSAVRKEIGSRTSLRLVDSRESDLVVHGTVREFKERLVAEGRTDQKIESTIVIVTRIVVEDYQNGRTWQETVTVHEPLSVEIGQTIEGARLRAVENLAERILDQIEAWDA